MNIQFYPRLSLSGFNPGRGIFLKRGVSGLCRIYTRVHLSQIGLAGAAVCPEEVKHYSDFFLLEALVVLHYIQPQFFHVYLLLYMMNQPLEQRH